LIIASERERRQNKDYPRGCAEMLEQQQAQLVPALEEMYYQRRKASAREGPSLDESERRSLTHDILQALDLLEVRDKGSKQEVYEGSCDPLQSRTTLDHAVLAREWGHARSKVADSYRERSASTTPGGRKAARSELSASSEQSIDRPSVTLPLVIKGTVSSLEASLQRPYAQTTPNHSTLQGSLAFINDTKAYVSSWEHAMMKIDESIQAYGDELTSSLAPDSAMEVTPHGSPTFANDTRSYVSEWGHEIMRMDETVQASCGESEAFDASDSQWEAASFSLDSHQDLLVSSNAPSVPDMNNLFQLDCITCSFNDFVWQPEMPT
jgi:hypothetical protein